MISHDSRCSGEAEETMGANGSTCTECDAEPDTENVNSTKSYGVQQSTTLHKVPPTTAAQSATAERIGGDGCLQSP